MMEEPHKLVLFHYHLLRGGVRTALLRSLQCLAQEGWLSSRTVILAVGRPDGVQSFAHSLKTLVHDVRVVVDERLDYRDTPWPDEETFRRDVRTLRDTILSWADGPTLFWPHNPTLGKNPAVTAAWKAAAEQAWAEGRPCRFLYHIHDFPECGRVQNMARLRRCWSHGGLTAIYPQTPNTAYAVLNSADHDRLRQCGLPSDRVFWLPNVMIPPTEPRLVLGDSRRRVLEDSLARYALDHGYTFDPRRPRWLVPVRLIRRKNILEALFLSAGHPETPQILITLDATSAQEKPYAQEVKNFVRRRRLPCVIGFGTELVGQSFSFEELMAWSDAVMTTSLLEGFGFAFLEGPLQGRPLYGRNLPDVTADFAAVGFEARSLYDTLPVPVSEKHRARLLAQGRRFAESYSRMLRTLSREAVERFLTRLEDVYGAPEVDFGMLDMEAQKELVDQVRNQMTPWDAHGRLAPAALDESVFDRFFARFGPTAHARRLTAAFYGIESPHAAHGTSEGIGKTPSPEGAHDGPMRAPEEPALLSSVPSELDIGMTGLFFDPSYQRPLFGGW